MNDPIADSLNAPLAISRRVFFWGLLSVVGAVLAGYIWCIRPTLSPNDNSRWDTVWSLVEYGTYEIFDTPEFGENQQFFTIDKVSKDGKYFSSKPPLLPTVAAGYVKLLKLVVGEEFSKDSKTDPSKGSVHIYAKAVLYAFQLAPFLVFLWLYRRFLDRYGLSDFTWAFCLVSAALGTFLTGYLVTFNNHVIAACFAFFTVYLLCRIWYDGQRQWWRFALAGLCAGWTAANELPAGLLVVVSLPIVLWSDWKRALFAFIPMLAIVTAGFFYTTHQAIGSYLPAYLQKDLYDYDTSYWADKKKADKADVTEKADKDAEKVTKPAPKATPSMSGIDALNMNPESLDVYFFHLTVGHHGLFSLTPLWLFALWGCWRCATGSEKRLAGLWLPVVFMSVVVFCFYWIKTTERNYGGFCHGVRWMIWLIPLWLMFLPAGIEPLVARRANGPHASAGKLSAPLGVAWACLVVSVFSMADTWYSPWTRSWLHRILVWFGVIDY